MIMNMGGGRADIAIAQQYASTYPFVKLFHNPKNLGPFLSRNSGALQSNGEYLLFLDCDDYLDLNACENLSNALDSSRDFQTPDIIGFNFFKQENKTFYKDTLFTQDSYFTAKQFWLYLFSQKKCYWNLWNKAYKKSTYLDALKSMDLQDKVLMAEDTFAFLALLCQAKNVQTLSSALYYYTQNPHSITQRTDKSKFEQSIKYHKLILHKISNLSITQSLDKQFLCKIFSYDLYCTLLNEMRIYRGDTIFYIYSNIQKKLLRFKRKIALKKLKQY